LEAFLVVAGKILGSDAGPEGAGDRNRRDILADEELALLAVETLDRARRAVAVGLIDPVHPQVRRLAHVRVRGDETKLRHSQTLLWLLFCSPGFLGCDNTSV